MTETEISMLHTIGHSHHSMERFIGLLRRYGITAVADVRSSPYSSYCPQFNREVLAADLMQADIDYVFMGKELGARPDDPSCYENGRVNFLKLAERTEFREGLEHLREGMKKHRIALMCAEKEPLECHRMILICRNLRQFGIRIRHILADGSIEERTDAEKRLVRKLKIKPSLFEQELTNADLIEHAYNQQAKRIAYQADAKPGQIATTTT